MLALVHLVDKLLCLLSLVRQSEGLCLACLHLPVDLEEVEEAQAQPEMEWMVVTEDFMVEVEAAVGQQPMILEILVLVDSVNLESQS
jgi:hypothetical protein